jgi:hypothetical protein
VIGTQFVVETDHESLQWLKEAKLPARLVRWALRLSEFEFTIKYRTGRANSNADGLSRNPIECSSASNNLDSYLCVRVGNARVGNSSISSTMPTLDPTYIAKQQAEDMMLQPILKALNAPELSNFKKEFEIKDSIQC